MKIKRLAKLQLFQTHQKVYILQLSVDESDTDHNDGNYSLLIQENSSVHNKNF